MTDAYFFICADCVTDPFLSDRIVASGRPGKCMSCSEEGQRCWPLAALAEHVRAAFDVDYCLREGVSPTSIVENLTGLSDAICEEILDRWSDITCLDDADPLDEDTYGSDACQADDDIADNDIDAETVERQWQKIRAGLLAPALPLSVRAVV
ncbi:hypothetical protein [Achromobacter aloeverae]|uniref:Uncharacterized protein n=1 Tax=Achromobacter aloeverae TaxID=1750518 RepID=A0A4Q1HPT4_9BURK|nr:hypothetical protein [Achromobacter aloeverae]RXN93074.1 hypothetical protein C7R54_04990 [Achromobacter aloeverae]